MLPHLKTGNIIGGIGCKEKEGQVFTLGSGEEIATGCVPMVMVMNIIHWIVLVN